jgi:hypothetical protein
MEKERLIKKAKKYLENSFVESSDCCQNHIEEWIDAVIKFRSTIQKECCTKTLRSLQHFILEESSSSDYIVRSNAMFGDLKEIRRDGFERRYLYNVKITKTYINAYKRTESEYFEMFGINRYSSYDSFRNVRNRHVKKK